MICIKMLRKKYKMFYFLYLFINYGKRKKKLNILWCYNGCFWFCYVIYVIIYWCYNCYYYFNIIIKESYVIIIIWNFDYFD